MDISEGEEPTARGRWTAIGENSTAQALLLNTLVGRATTRNSTAMLTAGSWPATDPSTVMARYRAPPVASSAVARAKVETTSRRICRSIARDACRRFRQSDASMARSEEHTSELQSLMRISYAVFCLSKKITAKLK